MPASGSGACLLCYGTKEIKESHAPGLPIPQSGAMIDKKRPAGVMLLFPMGGWQGAPDESCPLPLQSFSPPPLPTHRFWPAPPLPPHRSQFSKKDTDYKSPRQPEIIFHEMAGGGGLSWQGRRLKGCPLPSFSPPLPCHRFQGGREEIKAYPSCAREGSMLRSIPGIYSCPHTPRHTNCRVGGHSSQLPLYTTAPRRGAPT